MDIKVDLDLWVGKLFDVLFVLVFILGANYVLENGILDIFAEITGAF